MTNDTIDTPLLELTDPALARPLPAALVTARTDILAASVGLDGRPPMIRTTAAVCLTVALLLASCQRVSDDPRCMARGELLRAAALIERADAAERAGDDDALRQAVEGADDLVARARGRLRSADTDGTDGTVRRMTEAANYLGFIIEDFAATGVVDGTLVQFAVRELDRPAVGDAAPMNC